MKVQKIAAITVLVFTVLGLAWVFIGESKSSNAILLSDATAAPITNSNEVAVFVNIANSGGPDRLLSVSSPTAASATFNSEDSRRVVPGDGKVSLAADGMHIVLKGVSGDLKDGRTLPISLTFEDAGTVSTRARLVAPRGTGVAAEYGLFGIGDICKVGEGEPAPNIEVIAKPTGDAWRIEVLSSEFEFTPDLSDGPHVPGTGHAHIYLNGIKLGRLYSPTTVIGSLPTGAQDIRVTLSTNDHRAYVVEDHPVSAAIRIIVE